VVEAINRCKRSRCARRMSCCAATRLMGDFMSCQAAIDLNYSALLDFGENDFSENDFT
jgi:hypothetical protein